MTFGRDSLVIVQTLNKNQRTLRRARALSRIPRHTPRALTEYINIRYYNTTTIKLLYRVVGRHSSIYH